VRGDFGFPSLRNTQEIYAPNAKTAAAEQTSLTASERERPTAAMCGGEVGTARSDNDTPPQHSLVTEAAEAEQRREVCKAHSGGGYFGKGC
jgi:hypothetical protein